MSPRQNIPAGQLSSVVQAPTNRALPQYPDTSEISATKQLHTPGHSNDDSQGCRHRPLRGILPAGQAEHCPSTQLPLQHSPEAVQLAPLDVHAAAQMPPSHLPLQHCLFFLHFFPVRLHSSSASATPPRPSDASVPPRRAAPISLSTLPRVMLPLASPLASSSKELWAVSQAICGLLSARLTKPVSGSIIRQRGPD
jgi:hypothetical protein